MSPVAVRRKAAQRRKAARAKCLPVGAVGRNAAGWECTVLSHSTGTFEDGVGMRVRWHRSGCTSYVRPGRLVLVAGGAL